MRWSTVALSRYSSATAASQAFSRSVPAPLARPASAAARPASSDAAERDGANGLPHQLRAMPQCAMTHVGSLASTFWNDATAAENQNECSCATPRSNSGWTPDAQDVGKCTEPSRSPGWPCACASCGWAVATPEAPRPGQVQVTAVMDARRNRMRLLRDEEGPGALPARVAQRRRGFTWSTRARRPPHTAESTVDHESDVGVELTKGSVGVELARRFGGLADVRHGVGRPGRADHLDQ